MNFELTNVTKRAVKTLKANTSPLARKILAILVATLIVAFVLAFCVFMFFTITTPIAVFVEQSQYLDKGHLWAFSILIASVYMVLDNPLHSTLANYLHLNVKLKRKTISDFFVAIEFILVIVSFDYALLLLLQVPVVVLIAYLDQRLENTKTLSTEPNLKGPHDGSAQIR